MSDAINAKGNNNQLGIDEHSLRELIKVVDDEIINIKTAFNKMEIIADDSSKFFIGDAGDAFRNKFKDILLSYPVLETCLVSYKTDLENFLNAYVNFEGHYFLSEDIESKAVNTSTGVN